MVGSCRLRKEAGGILFFGDAGDAEMHAELEVEFTGGLSAGFGEGAPGSGQGGGAGGRLTVLVGAALPVDVDQEKGHGG